MDRRSRSFTPRGRGRGRQQSYWRAKTTTKENSHNLASGVTTNLSGETPSSSKDDVPVNDVSRLEGVVNPNSVSNASFNSTDKRHELCGSGKEQLVDDDEKSGNSGTFSQRHGLAAGANSFSQIVSCNKDDASSYENPPSEERLRGNNSKQSSNMNTFKGKCDPFHNTSCEKVTLPDVKNISPVDNDAKSDDYLCSDTSLDVANTTSPFSNANIKNTPTKDDIQSEKTSEKEIESMSSDNLNCQSSGVLFDICRPISEDVKPLKLPLLEANRLKRAEAKRIIEGHKIIEFRSGMVLLKKYISFDNQVKIVKEIRDLGVGVGGFYEPGYRDGGKLHLKMMCLGKNWDPQKMEYGDKRQIDDSKPPSLPNFFLELVKGAIEDSHSFLRECSRSPDVKRVLPLMSPNICIVNFYTKSGRLGLHQDKDESKESLRRQLPVVSFSIGDSAVFLYGDERDPEKADKVVLESGDVLIFGGKSRLVYHGVDSIESDTAPKALLEETRLHPGRLNLTFREF